MPATPVAVGVILVAAGSGTRLGAEVPKAFVPLAGQPLIGRSLQGALSCPGLVEVVLVVPAGYTGQAEELARSASEQQPSVPITVVVGGRERTDSVRAGLAALSDAVPADGVVLVHDAARALAPTSLYERVVAAVGAGASAVVPGVTVNDTIKIVDDHGFVQHTPDRSGLRAIQTPQGFRRDVLEQAHAIASAKAGAALTDDAMLVEALGHRVLVVDGEQSAFKVTSPPDLQRAEAAVAAEVPEAAFEA